MPDAGDGRLPGDESHPGCERREGGSQIPIIALTANAFASDREKCLAAGMSDYLSKPFTADDIVRQLRKWLSHGVGAGSAAA